MEQALPGDNVDWTEADYHATIGQLYAHISLQQKQINVLRQVRDEYVGMIAAAAEDRQRLSGECARLQGELDGYAIKEGVTVKPDGTTITLASGVISSGDDGNHVATPAHIHEKQP